MGKPSRHIKKHIKKSLIREAGGKCANPGCHNSRVEIHHIELWAVVKTHDEAHMIAVCPSCHDACHHGDLIIDDATLYQWKKIDRPPLTVHSQIWAEPASSPRLLLGSITFKPAKPQKLTLFKLSEKNKLSFTINDTWLQVNATLSDSNNQLIAKITDNNLTGHLAMGVELIQRPGKFQILVPTEKYYLPAKHLFMMQQIVPSYGSTGKITAIDLEVIAPGLIKVQGFWSKDNHSVVITEDAISFCRPDLERPKSLVGAGEDTTVVYMGSVEQGLFSLMPFSPGTIKI